VAKIKGQVLIDKMCDRMGWAKSTAGSGTAERANALFALNEAEGAIAQLASFLHLAVRTTLSLVNSATVYDLESLPGSGSIDFGKQMTIGLPGGRGLLEYLDHDAFLSRTSYKYGAWNLDRPSAWTLGVTTVAAGSVGLRRIFFDPGNASGSTLAYAFTYQQLPATLLDDNATESSLPLGYETSLLLPMAELEEKRKLGYAGWKDLHTKLHGDESDPHGRIGRFIDQYAAGKEDSKPDSEQARRKQSEKLSEGT
jgi:hypothetical protein